MAIACLSVSSSSMDMKYCSSMTPIFWKKESPFRPISFPCEERYFVTGRTPSMVSLVCFTIVCLTAGDSCCWIAHSLALGARLPRQHPWSASLSRGATPWALWNTSRTIPLPRKERRWTPTPWPESLKDFWGNTPTTRADISIP